MVRSETRQRRRLAIMRRTFTALVLVFCVAYFSWPIFSDKINIDDSTGIFASFRDNAEAETETDFEEDALTDVVNMAKTSQTVVDEKQNLLVLVNKHNALPNNYVPDNLVDVNIVTQAASGQQLSAPAAAAFEELAAAAKAEEHTIKLISGFRSYDTQKQLYESYVRRDGDYASEYSAEPGRSEHQTGLAADVSSPSVEYDLVGAFGYTKEGEWLAKNAHKFGFIIRYQEGKEDITGYIYEPWHIRYVGKDAAPEIYEQGLTLEEYLDTH